jgi:ankyrin repeat-rich membrane spanning protein
LAILYCTELYNKFNKSFNFLFKGGWTALMWATYKGRSEATALLLDRGAEVNAHGNYHISSLLWAAGRGYVDIAKDLIRHGAKVNVGDKVFKCNL